MIDRQSGHSNVDSRLGWIALWIMPQNRPILQRSFAEQDDVNVMMEFRFGGSKPSQFTTTHSMTVHLGPASREVYQLSLSGDPFCANNVARNSSRNKVRAIMSLADQEADGISTDLSSYQGIFLSSYSTNFNVRYSLGLAELGVYLRRLKLRASR